jgi:response regulator RpfG family c-di-GMP phosphodiesterase
MDHEPVVKPGKSGKIIVLYVEDEMSNQMAMQSILASCKDIELYLASDEDDIVEYMESDDPPPNVVLMDQGLGRTSGGEVCFHQAVCSCLRVARANVRRTDKIVRDTSSYIANTVQICSNIDFLC